MTTHSLTAERLRSILQYDPETGAFTRDGRSVGTLAARGRITIKIDGVRHYAHRLAWLYVTGVHADGDLDHRDVDGTNNRFANLRECHDSTNQANRKRQRN